MSSLALEAFLGYFSPRIYIMRSGSPSAARRGTTCRRRGGAVLRATRDGRIDGKTVERGRGRNGNASEKVINRPRGHVGS